MRRQLHAEKGLRRARVVLECLRCISRVHPVLFCDKPNVYGLHHLGLSQYSSSTVPLVCQKRGCRGWAHPTRPAHTRDPLWINGFGCPLRFVLASASACADCATAHSASGLGSSMPRLHRDLAHLCHVCTGTGM